MKGLTGAKQAAIERELMRKRMKFYLAPVAAVLFRASHRVYFLWHPQDLAVAAFAVPLCDINESAAPSPAVAASGLVAGIYSLW